MLLTQLHGGVEGFDSNYGRDPKTKFDRISEAYNQTLIEVNVRIRHSSCGSFGVEGSSVVALLIPFDIKVKID